MLKRLHLSLNEQSLIVPQSRMIESIAVRATRASSDDARKKRGADEPVDHALGRSRGSLTTKIDMLCGANGHRCAFSSPAVKPVTSAMPKNCWTTLAFRRP